MFLSQDAIRELEQLYDTVLSMVNEDPELTWEDIRNQFPETVLEQAVEYGLNRSFMAELQRRTFADEDTDDLQIHREIQQMFVELVDQSQEIAMNGIEAERYYEEGDDLPW